MWLARLELRDVRNFQEAVVTLGPGLNVFSGSNAQGKTSLLEAVGLLSRGRSFRTEQTASLVRRGASRLLARGVAVADGRQTSLEVELGPGSRQFRVDGREVSPREYQGRLEVAVYATDRLRVVRGSMRERRQYLDRGAAALWPAYRRAVGEYERVVLQRNAALVAGGRDVETWNERFVELGAELRQRRSEYVRRLSSALRQGFRPCSEEYAVALSPAVDHGAGDAATRTQRETLRREVESRRRDETLARRSLVGPHRDSVFLGVDGRDAADGVSSGQVRSLLLALTVATLDVYAQESGRPPVALLDDLDSELDERRARAACEHVVRRGQALVTTAHAGWAEAMRDLGRTFEVAGGCVQATAVS